jgi:hypothetical protein
MLTKFKLNQEENYVAGIIDDAGAVGAKHQFETQRNAIRYRVPKWAFALTKTHFAGCLHHH